MTSLEYPLNRKTIDRCQAEIDINSHKGNSWKDMSVEGLVIKLQEEYAELVLALQKDARMVEKEGADLINVTAMLVQRYRQHFLQK